MIKSDYYTENDENLTTDSERILKKLKIINSEQMKWFEELIAMVIAVVGYMSPVWLMVFQKKMRQMEMQTEVMQFQTIILIS